ncbi:MAG: glycosyltransferase family 39 protein [Pseudomonadota bacterium]
MFARSGALVFGGILLYSLAFSFFLDDTLWRKGTLLLLCLIGLGFFNPVGRRFTAAARGLLARLPLWSVLFVGALLRVSWALNSGVRQTSDFFGYQRDAYFLLKGAPLLDPLKPNGAAFLYAACYSLFHAGNLGPQLVNALLSSLQILCVYVILYRVTQSRSAGRIGALILALWPEHVIFCNLLSSEVPFTTMVLGSYALFTLSEEGAWKKRFVLLGLSGFLLGWAHWIRPFGPIMLVAPLLAEAFGRTPGSRFSLGRFSFLLSAFLIPIGILCWVNMRTIGVASPNPAQTSGWSFLVGTNVKYAGQWNREDDGLFMAESERPSALAGVHPAVMGNRLAWDLALRRIAQDPRAFASMVFTQKLWRLWPSAGYLGWSLNTSVLKEQWIPISLVADVLHHLAVILSAILLLIPAKPSVGRFNIVHGFLWVAVLVTGVHAFLEMSPRYHHPFIPLFALVLAYFGADFFASGQIIDKPPVLA